jgi:hypothetical protein
MDWDKPRKPLRLPGRWFRILEALISNVDLETNFESVTLFYGFAQILPDNIGFIPTVRYDRFLSRLLQPAMVPPFNGV